ncbi:MAG: FAD:protein FMN transferase [Firmicutes bacterium HGW-Firmicutes-12]|nr:MAG: FAD:protein FMN transferase [Firmicutes bacterium HGW-Firmicutes-12]
MKKVFIVLLAVILLISGCANKEKQASDEASGYEKYSYEFFGAFDTVIQFIGYTRSEDEFEQYVNKAQGRYEELHKMFDKYNDYSGINNIKTINDNAGIQPVIVSQEIIDLILFSKEWYKKTNETFNIALGPVLSIWHDYREEGKSDPEHAAIPTQEELQTAANLTDLDKVIVDEEIKSIFLSEHGMSVDVGAVAKGFATEIVTRELMEAGIKSCIISCGGNVRIIGKPYDGIRNKWGIGIQDPQGNALIPDDEPLDTVYIRDTSLVTSGDYQRFYVVDGNILHHLIDPKTLMPANHFRAVTVMVEDSGIADIMSTAVFLLSYEESNKLVESIEGLEALWIFPDGVIKSTQGMKEVMKSKGASAQ